MLCVCVGHFFFAIRIISKGDLFIILLKYVKNISLCWPLAGLPSTNLVTTKPSKAFSRKTCSNK